MPGDRPRLYWDACVFLSFINGDAGRCEVIEQLLDEADSGQHEIWTSTVTIVEVAFGKAEQDQAASDPTLLAAIDAFWLEGSAVNLVEFHRLIGIDARDLVRLTKFDSGRRTLKPMDAIHLASAQRIGANDFHTYDSTVLDQNGRMPYPIREPHAAQGQLFPKSAASS